MSEPPGYVMGKDVSTPNCFLLNVLEHWNISNKFHISEKEIMSILVSKVLF